MEPNKIREYCLNCINKPCSKLGCPLNNDIPNFIHEEDAKKAFEILSNTTVLPVICGRICPHEKQCEGKCVRGINGEPVSIGEMEAYIGNRAIENGYKIPVEIDEKLTNKKVAIIGSGPAGITCGAFLARKGVKVTIYEKYNELGGLMVHGIPEFRLSKEIVKTSIDKILELGIDVQTGKELGKNFSIEELKEEYDAVFLSIGANIPSKMNIVGEDLDGVFGGNSLLEMGKHPSYKNKKVAVIGGGNVAMDTARTIKRLGAEKVYIIYRREEEQMPAERKEIAEAKREEVEFLFKTNVIRILGSSYVEKIECIKTELVQKEGDSRLYPVNIKNSNYLMDMDYVVMAIGGVAEDSAVKNFDRDEKGYIKTNENMETSIKGVFAGGDVVGERKTVAWAARSGRDAAEKIIKKLKEI